MEIVSTLYRDYSDLIDYNFKINTENTNIYLLIGMASIKIDGVLVPTNYNYTGSELQRLFDIYSHLGDLNPQNGIDQKYVKFVKLIDESLNINRDDPNELKSVLYNLINDFTSEIRKSFKDIMTSLIDFKFIYKYSGITIEIVITFDMLKQFLFNKGISRFLIFDYCIKKIIETGDIFTSSNDIYKSIAVMIVVLQIFSDGNHRTGYYYLKSKMYITQDDGLEMIKNFRKIFMAWKY